MSFYNNDSLKSKAVHSSNYTPTLKSNDLQSELNANECTYEEFVYNQLSNYLKDLQEFHNGIVDAKEKLRISFPFIRKRGMNTGKSVNRTKSKERTNLAIINSLLRTSNNFMDHYEKPKTSYKKVKRSVPKLIPEKKLWVLIDIRKARRITKQNSVVIVNSALNDYKEANFNKTKTKRSNVRNLAYRPTTKKYNEEYYGALMNVRYRSRALTSENRTRVFKTFYN